MNSAIMLHGHIVSTFLHMCAKTQATAICTSHDTATYMLATNIPVNYYIYAKNAT